MMYMYVWWFESRIVSLMGKNKALYSVVLKVIVRKAKTVEFEKIKPVSNKINQFQKIKVIWKVNRNIDKQEERENDQWKQNREHGDEVTDSAWVLVR